METHNKHAFLRLPSRATPLLVAHGGFPGAVYRDTTSPDVGFPRDALQLKGGERTARTNVTK